MNVLETTMTSSGVVTGGKLVAAPQNAPSCAAVEVVVMWEGIVQKVVHRDVGGKKATSFTIGEDPTCDFPVPAESLAGMSSITLVDLTDEDAVATVPPGATGEVVFPGGTIRDLSEVEGNRITMKEGYRTVVNLGPWTFLVRSTARQDKFLAAAKIDWTPNLFAGVSIGLHALFFLIVSLVPPGANGLINDPNSSNNRFSKYMIVPQEVKMEVLPEMLERKENDDKINLGKAHAGVTGQAGDRNAPKTNKRYGIKGPPDTKQIRMARDTIKDMAQSAGILQYLSNAAAPTSPFGSDNPVGVDPENALGGLLGDQVGATFGYGGMGLYGTGRGGGGTGLGTIGIGNLSSITGDFINAKKNPYKGRPIFKDGNHKPTGPRVKSHGVITKGSISKATIRRLVQRQLPQIKHCYEKGLSKRPDLEGRISVRFVISSKGVVQTAAVVDSTLSNTPVEQCIARAVQRITFPQPDDGGVVIATYPFALTSPNN